MYVKFCIKDAEKIILILKICKFKEDNKIYILVKTFQPLFKTAPNRSL